MWYLNNLVIVVCAFQVGFGTCAWLTRLWPTRESGLPRYARWMRFVASVSLMALSLLAILGAKSILVYPILVAQLVTTGFWHVSAWALKREARKAWTAPLPGETR